MAGAKHGRTLKTAPSGKPGRRRENETHTSQPSVENATRTAGAGVGVAAGLLVVNGAVEYDGAPCCGSSRFCCRFSIGSRRRQLRRPMRSNAIVHHTRRTLIASACGRGAGSGTVLPVALSLCVHLLIRRPPSRWIARVLRRGSVPEHIGRSSAGALLGRFFFW